MALSPKLYTWLCGLFAALGSMTFGYDLGIIASVLPSENFRQTTGYPTPTQEGLVTGLLLLGGFASNVWVGNLTDAIGRRKAILIGVIIFLIGGTIQTAAQNLHMMMGGRFVAGMGIGMLVMLAPLYQAEIAHPSIRGRLTTLQQFMLGKSHFYLRIGALIASFIGYACFETLEGKSAQWRIPLAIQLVPAIPLGFFILLLPESPRWLAGKGRHEEALQTLARLHANGNVNDLFVRTEHADIILGIEKEKVETEHAWRELLTNKSQLRRLFLGVSLQFSVQMTGVSVLQYFSPRIFASIGIDSGLTLLLQSCNSIIAICGEVACILLVDRLGRRKPLITANALSGLTFVISTIIIAVFPAESGNKAAAGAFVTMTWIFNFVFSSAIGPLSWAIPVEMFPSSTRAKATAITSAFSWISNFMIAQVSPPAFAAIGWKFYIIFAICGFTNALFFWAFLPETKGRKLEEMDAYFARVPFFVPSASKKNIEGIEDVGQFDREDEMRAGQVGLHENVDAPTYEEKKDTTEVEHRDVV